MPYLYGIDTSSNNGLIDWSQVAASGQAFAWTKATEGLNYINPNFASDWVSIKANGMIRGAYHFAHPENNPYTEAAYFLNIVGKLEPTDLIALDLEIGSGDLHIWTENFLDYVTKQSGTKPFLYSGTWFLEPHDCLNDPTLAQYYLWLSGYQANAPAVPADWDMFTMWQFTNKAIVPGVPDPVDQSVFIGTLDQLKAYGMASPTPPQMKPLDVIVNDASVIGDMTYPDNVDMWSSPAPNQQVCRAVFIRELVQHIKAVAGA